jgi:putative transposase
LEWCPNPTRPKYYIDVHRQAYNYTRYEYGNVDADNIGSAYKHHYRLPDWKDEFSVFSEVDSKALQPTVTRFYQNLNGLSEQKQNGRKVGKLKSKSPTEYHSMTYSRSGFEIKDTSGRHATLELSKVGDIRIRYHPEIPGQAEVKEVIIKKETIGGWFVSFGLETGDADLPENPDVDSLNTSNSVGIDFGILNYSQPARARPWTGSTQKATTSDSDANSVSCLERGKARTATSNSESK